MNKNLKGELAIMDSLGIKPNYAALGRKYGMDPRTVKKYHNGYEGKPATREKGSMLDQYRQEISDKLKIPRVTVQGVYEFMVKKYGIDSMGSRSNFQRYVKDNDLRTGNETSGNPRYEKGPGEQAQVDWKEDISIADRNGEIFTINILHIVLKYSRFSHLEISIQKRFEDVSRGLINGFIRFGGVPEELLFDNMFTVANTKSRPKRPTAAMARMAREFGFKVRLCRTRKAETKGTVEARNKVKQEDVYSIAAENLARMDSLLESRKIAVSEVEATKSAEALIAYLNQSDYGKWIIGYYAHLTADERHTFIKGMNRILPHVDNREAFMSHIKFSMKEIRCRNLDFDCWVNDFMASDKAECILTDEGYRIIQDRYSEEITGLIEGLMASHDDNETEDGMK